MTTWNYIVICLSLVLLTLLLTYEWKRANRARLVWRLSATVILMAALAALVLPITYKRSAAVRDKEGILLTEGYDPDSVRVFAQARNASVWASPAEEKDPGLSVLHIFGYGLTGEQCAALPPVPLVFHPSAMRAGITSIYWQRSLWTGEACRIQGHFYNPGEGTVKLLLTGMHTVLDSAEIKKDVDFELRTVPVHTGQAVYRLIALNGADTLEQESIPVEVLQGKPLKILILAAAPDFENRFLVNWLSEKGHSVVVRTAISKGKYDFASLNMTTGAEGLSTLDKFDIVIADAAALNAMPGEYRLLRKEVEQRGLGLIIKADSTSGKMDRPGGRSLIKDSLGRTLVSASMYGAGKIILTSLQTTYTRWLEGNKREYASLWTSIMQQAAKESTATERWQLSPALPVVDQPVKATLRYSGSESGLPEGLFEYEGVTPVVSYLTQHPLLPFVWEGLYWPRGAGWQTVRTSQGTSAWWYAWTADDWQALHRKERMGETERWVARMRNRKTGTTEGREDVQRVPVWKGWFYLSIIICCLFLWVERKI